MGDSAASRFQRATGRLLGGDSGGDLALVVGAFAAYGVVDAGSRLVANVQADRLDGSVLLVGAIASNPVAYTAMLVALGMLLWRAPRRVWSRWDDLEQGRVLRLLTIPLVLLVAWQSSLYEFNFLLGQAHFFDRALVLVLAGACLARPLFIVPLVVESRIIANQFEFPFGTTAAQNIDELLLIALSAIAGIHILYVITGRRETAPVVLVLSAALAAHFYIPGSTKLVGGWLVNNDLSNLPLSGYTAGWRGDGSGRWAQQMSSITESLGRFGLAGTLVLELGSILALLHYRLLRIWLPACILFHLIVFAFVGFWFLPWIVLEAALIALTTRPELRGWLNQNVTPARTLVTVGAVVVGGSSLFHPPTLSWLDAPVSYGYRIEATGESGTQYLVPSSAFAPYQQELAFFQLQAGPRQPVSAAYGALSSPDELHDLETVATFAEVEAREISASESERAITEEFLSKFLSNANDRGATAWSIMSPPNHFWTSTGDPVFAFDEPLRQLDVYVLTAIHRSGKQDFKRELVLTLDIGPDGSMSTG